MFVSNEKIAEIAEELLIQFEHGDLHSRQKTSVIARAAQEILAENGLPTRWSLACVVANLAKSTWQEEIFRTKKTLKQQAA